MLKRVVTPRNLDVSRSVVTGLIVFGFLAAGFRNESKRQAQKNSSSIQDLGAVAFNPETQAHSSTQGM